MKNQGNSDWITINHLKGENLFKKYNCLTSVFFLDRQNEKEINENMMGIN